MKTSDNRPSYTTNDPRGWCGDMRRGAAMGRAAVHEAPQTFAGKLTLRVVRLNQGGYDANGTYFGSGEPLWWYASDDGEIDSMLRAPSRAAAKAAIGAKYPTARFWR